MVDYQPIAELVKQIPADTWKILQEIQKRRPAMMLDELLDKRERAPKPAPNARARKAAMASCPVASMTRSRTATPARSPSAASSSARLALSSLPPRRNG